MEMAFVDGAPEPVAGDPGVSNWSIGGSQVRDVVEGMVKRIWREVQGVHLEDSFRVMPYNVAMDVVGASCGYYALRC